MSGVKIIYIAFKNHVDVLPTIPEDKTAFEDFSILSEGGVGAGNTDIKMIGDNLFFRLETTVDLGELSYPQQGPSGCHSFLATLNVYHSGFKSKILGFLGAVTNRELIILAKLNNGDIHMLGDKDRGAILGDGTTATSGKALTDQNGTDLFFTYPTPTPRIYIGDIDSITSNQSSGSGV
jgi:hypothetical protein